jgi:hypothetical protein
VAAVRPDADEIHPNDVGIEMADLDPQADPQGMNPQDIGVNPQDRPEGKLFKPFETLTISDFQVICLALTPSCCFNLW